MPNHFHGHITLASMEGSKGADFIKDKFPPGEDFYEDGNDATEFFNHCGLYRGRDDDDHSYHDHIKFLGSKWGAYDWTYHREDFSDIIKVSIHYQSAWCAPERGFHRLAVKHDLFFKGWGQEEGCGFISSYNNEGSVTTNTLAVRELREKYPDFESKDFKEEGDGYYIEDEDSEDEDAAYAYYEAKFMEKIVEEAVKEKGRSTWFDDFRQSWDAHTPDGTQDELDRYYVKEYNELFEKL